MMHLFEIIFFKKLRGIYQIRYRGYFSAGDSESFQFPHKFIGRVVIKNIFHIFHQMLFRHHSLGIRGELPRYFRDDMFAKPFPEDIVSDGDRYIPVLCLIESERENGGVLISGEFRIHPGNAGRYYILFEELKSAGYHGDVHKIPPSGFFPFVEQ